MTSGPCSVPDCERVEQLRLGMCNMHWRRCRKNGDAGPAATLRSGVMGECAAPECELPTRSSGAEYCEAHYYRLRRTGTLHARPQPQRQLRLAAASLQSHMPLRCSVEACDDLARSVGMCKKHATRMRRHGDPNTFIPPHERKMVSGPASPKWLSDDVVDYRTIHQRVKRLHGSARSHRCADCERPAIHWSYDHADPDERLTPDGLAYSIDLAHYSPRCASCHKFYDHAILRAAAVRRGVERIVRAAEAGGHSAVAAFVRSQVSDDGGSTLWPVCDGRWLETAPEALEVA